MRTIIAVLLLCSCATSPVTSTITPTTSITASTTTLAPQAPPTSSLQIAATVSKESVTLDHLTEIVLRRENPCPEWFDVAIDAGWPLELWPQQSYIIWRESRCDTFAFNATDPHGGSRGLMQINQYWCKPGAYSDNGWLQDNDVLMSCEELHSPHTQMQAALAMFNYSQQRTGNGWNPWGVRAKFVPPSVEN